MANSCGGKEEIFTFYWKISNLCFSTLKNGEFISSPEFTLPNFEETTWRLKLYPKGDAPESAEYISCYLYRINDSGPTSISIKVNVQSSVTKKVPYCFENEFSKMTGKGCAKFIPLNISLQRNDPLIIVCKLQYLEPIQDTLSNSEKFLPFSMVTDSNHVSSILQEFNSNFESHKYQIKKKMLQYPTACFVQTQFCSNKIFVAVPLDASLVTGSKLKEILPVLLSTKSSSLAVVVSRNEETIKNLSVDIYLLNAKIKKSMLVICQLSVLLNEVVVAQLPREEHIFYVNNAKEIWKFKESVDISDLASKLKDSFQTLATWKVELTIADGKIRSEVLWEETTEIADSTMPSYVSPLSNQMLEFYKNKKFCDVVLKIKNESFHVHKSVLAATSPVFSAMFDSDMNESATNTVKIVDFDKETVNELISFMYSGTVDNLDFENAQKLYAAADKYQVMPLMSRCRKFIMDNISIPNVCTVLLISDRHNDLKLREAVVRFICFCENLVFISNEWKQFEKVNMTLANEILKLICFSRRV